MIKKYTIYLIFILTLSVFSVSIAQEKQSAVQKTELNFYPNPVSDGKIFITSNITTSNKEVEIFDVLGKSVLKVSVVRELNISSLSPGVYLIKIKEGENSVTRKLIIK